MKFKQYLTEGRSKTINEDEAKKLLKKHCRKAINAWNESSPIYRGLRSSADYIMIDPKSGKSRPSANTFNYYTLINDNSKGWSRFPKRSKSIICTTNVSYTSGYGKGYTVFPYDGAMIGVCPSKDYWESFQYSLGQSTWHLHNFNAQLVKMFKRVNVPINDFTFNDIKNSFEMFDNVINDRQIKTFEDEWDWMSGYDGDLMDHIQYILHPNNNSFKVVKIGTDLRCDDCEVWTDSKSIMIEWKYNNDPSAKIIQELGF